MSRIAHIEKKKSGLSWRETNQYLHSVNQFTERASNKQSFATVHVTGKAPISLISLSDLHIGAQGFDHETLVRVTDEILSTPDLYVGLFGDIVEMAIRLRSVAEVMNQSLTPQQQTYYARSWFEEIAPKVLFATWGNHDIERQEQLAGYSDFADIFAANVIYYNSIGHLDLIVGEQTYKLAVSHRFRGHGMYNPAQGAVRYLMLDAPTREVAICGDSHRPGICQFTHGETVKLAVTSGTLNTNSDYTKRKFSLYSHTNFPVIMFRGDEHHEFSAFWGLGPFLRATKG